MLSVKKKDGTLICLLQDTDIERGSNENGEYIKYANGILIQCGYAKIDIVENGTHYGSIGVTYPIKAKSIIFASASNIYSYSSSNIWSTGYQEMDKISLYLYNRDGLNAGSTADVYWLMIGKWK